jgi:TonB-dependent receptor
VRSGNWREENKEYTNVFPNLQAKYNVTRNLITRASFSTSILRPDFINIAPRSTVNDTGTSVRIELSNLDLEPETAKSYDLGIEYYFPETVGSITAAVFRKDISDVHVDQTTTDLDDPRFADDATIANLDSATAASFRSTGNIELKRTLNAGKAKVTGFELAYNQDYSFLPGIFKGLGAFANYTYLDVDYPQDFYVFESPSNLVNFGVNYKYSKFDVQIKGNYKGQSITVWNQGTGEFQWEESFFTWDLNMNYKVHKYAKLFLNVRNVFNTPRYWTSVFHSRMWQQEEYGAAITFGVKGNF